MGAISSVLGTERDLVLVALRLCQRGANVLEDEMLTGRIIGAAVQVHRELGPGFLESIYEAALAIELENRAIRFERQFRVPVTYQKRKVGAHRLDLVVANKVVVEIKAVQELQSAFFRVVRSYMRATQLNRGLILNFGTPLLEVKRVFPSLPRR